MTTTLENGSEPQLECAKDVCSPPPSSKHLRENDGWCTWRPWRNSQYRRQDNYKLMFCWWHWQPGWTTASTGKVGKPPWRGLHSVWHALMQISAEKTQLMTDSTNGISVDITIDNKKLKPIRSFKDLGAVVSDQGCKPKVLFRITQTTAAVTKLEFIWNDMNIAISSKIRLMRSLAMSKFLYACETWTITADIERRIQTLEMRCFRKLLGISCRDHITSVEVKARIGNAIRPNEDLLTPVKRCKLKWYGHITRSSGLAKTILQGTVQGMRQRGRQRKWWEDNIKEWTGLEWNYYYRKLRIVRNGGSWL